MASNNKEAQKAVASAERVESNTEEAIDRIKTQVSVTLDTLNKNVTSNFDKLSGELESELDDTVKTVNKSLVQLRKDALTCQRQGFVENAKGKCVPSAQVTPTTCNATLVSHWVI